MSPMQRALGADWNRRAMDFRMAHPWFGQLFRYCGQFETTGSD